MGAKERGLGRGLNVLFRNAEEVSSNEDTIRLPVTALSPGKSQPRRHFDEQALEELASSIRSQGVIQPILARPIAGSQPQQYEIVAGERRWRAAQRAGLTDIPAVVRNLSDDEVLTMALIENIQREDLNAVEEAQAIEKLRLTLNLSQDDLAKRLGKSRSAIANALRLLQLPETMLDSLSSGRISAGHARCLLAVADGRAQHSLHAAILERDLSVRDAESAVTHWKHHFALPESLTGLAPAQPTKTGLAPSRAKAPVIMTLQRHLRRQVHPKITLNGSMDMGRITLPYESADQLAKILTQLGVSLDVIGQEKGKSA